MKKDAFPRKPNVLAVDDYEANLLALESVLSSECHLITASSGAAALEILKTQKNIDVILMDVQMPGMDGYETAIRAKKISGYEDIAIIFVTAIYKEDPFVKKGYASGGIDYFGKPFDPDILRMKVGIYASYRQKSEILKERERQIRETEELVQTGRKLSASLESLKVGVLIADVEGRICQMNGQVARICKTDQSAENESYGVILDWWDLNGRMLKEENGPLYRAIHFGEISHNQSIEIRCLDGTQKMVLGSASPLLGLDNHIVGAVVILQDISISKEIEADLEHRINQLVSAGVALEKSIHN